MLISREHIISKGFIRGLKDNFILDYHVDVAEEIWVRENWGETFWNDVHAAEEDYIEWILEFVAPVIAIGTMYNNFESLTQPLTEAGLAQFINENGVMTSSAESRKDFKIELYKNLGILIRRMNRDGWSRAKMGDPLFLNYPEPTDNPKKRLHGTLKTIGAPG